MKKLIGLVQAHFPRLAERARLLKPHARERRQRLQSQSRAEVFASIYQANEWKDAESLSGDGSTLAVTESVRSLLPKVLNDYKVQTLVDMPCGDFNWISHIDFASTQYVGVDIVPDLIEGLQAQFGNQHRRFEVGDAVDGSVPTGDAVLCRDLLLHLSLPEAEAVVDRLRAEYRVVMISTNPNVRKNLDIVTGESRQLNLLLAPFNLPKATVAIPDGTERFPHRIVGVWVNEATDG